MKFFITWFSIRWYLLRYKTTDDVYLFDIRYKANEFNDISQTLRGNSSLLIEFEKMTNIGFARGEKY